MAETPVPKRYSAEVDRRVRERDNVAERTRVVKKNEATRRTTGVSRLLGDVLKRTDPQQFAVVASQEAQVSGHNEVVAGQTQAPTYAPEYREVIRPDDDGRPDPLFTEACRVDVSLVDGAGGAVKRSRVFVNVPVDVTGEDVPDSVDVPVSDVEVPEGWVFASGVGETVTARVHSTGADSFIANVDIVVEKETPEEKPQGDAPIVGLTQDVSSTVKRTVRFVHHDTIVEEKTDSFTFTGTKRGDDISWDNDEYVFAAVNTYADRNLVIEEAADYVEVTPDSDDVTQTVELGDRFVSESVTASITVATELLIGSARYTREPYSVNVDIPTINDQSGDVVSDPSGFLVRQITDVVSEHDGLVVQESKFDVDTNTVHVVAVPPSREELMYPPRETGLTEPLAPATGDNVYAIDVYPAGFLSHATQDSFDPVGDEELGMFIDLSERVGELLTNKVNRVREQYGMGALKLVSLSKSQAEHAWEWAVDAMLKKHIGRTRELGRLVESTGLRYGNEILIHARPYRNGLSFDTMLAPLIEKLGVYRDIPGSIMSEQADSLVVAPLVRYIDESGVRVSASMSVVSLHPSV